MIRFALFFFISLWAVVSFSSVERVRVRITSNKHTILLGGTINKFGTQTLIGNPFADRQGGELKWDIENKKWIWTNLEKGISLVQSKNPLVVSGSKIYLDGMQVNKSLFFYGNSNGQFDVVSSLLMKDYLKGVLPSEMSALWPMEALKAQVIASRSYAVSRIKKMKNKPYHLESTVMDQVFRFSDGFLKPRELDRVIKAIDETKGLILTSANGRGIKAHFHADCGGATELPHYVWGGMPSKMLTSVNDPHGDLGPFSDWQVTIKKSELENILNIQNIKFLRTHLKTPSGRVSEVVIKSSRGENKIRAEELRKKIGYTRLKSTNFTLAYKGKDLIFKGKGHGHGVGLCQWGARHWAKEGWGFRKILTHYYPFANISE